MGQRGVGGPPTYPVYRVSRSSRINCALSENDRPSSRRLHVSDNECASFMVSVSAARFARMADTRVHPQSLEQRLLDEFRDDRRHHELDVPLLPHVVGMY